MKRGAWFFNLYVLCVLALVVAGCASSGKGKRSKEMALLSLHLEENPDGTPRNQIVYVSREHRVPVSVQVTPFLDQRSLTKAILTEELGGFAIALQFERHGTWALEQMTTSYKDARLAVLCRWTNGKERDTRWLAAPRIEQAVTNGVFIFTPDATRQEAELIVRGLNNVAVQIGNAPKPKKE